MSLKLLSLRFVFILFCCSQRIMFLNSSSSKNINICLIFGHSRGWYFKSYHSNWDCFLGIPKLPVFFLWSFFMHSAAKLQRFWLFCQYNYKVWDDLRLVQQGFLIVAIGGVARWLFFLVSSKSYELWPKFPENVEMLMVLSELFSISLPTRFSFVYVYSKKPSLLWKLSHHSFVWNRILCTRNSPRWYVFCRDSVRRTFLSKHVLTWCIFNSRSPSFWKDCRRIMRVISPSFT